MSRRAFAAFTACSIASAFESDIFSLVQLKATNLEGLLSNSTVDVGSLPPLMDDFPEDVFKQCKNDHLSEWKGRSDSTQAVLKAWVDNSDGAIVKDTGDSSCLAGGDPSSSKKVLTLVKEPEAELCKLSPQGRKAEEQTFAVSGALAELSATRKYQIVWPEDGTCSKDNKCGVMIFFHGCASMVIPQMQAQADEQCFSNLNTVMILPKLEKDERWTESGTTALEEFVMPLWEHVKETYGEKLDTDRVAAAGASLGSGMALQAALLRPDVFTMAMVVGLADGSHCEDGDGGKVDFDKAAILAGKAVPHDSWKLKGLVVVMSEKETELDTRLTALLNLLDDNDVTKEASLHMRLYGDAGHAAGILYSFNQWAGLHNAIFGGHF